MADATTFIFEIGILIFSVVIHEVSHGYIALLLGDRTAYYAGRLTFNPIKHLDPFGSVLLPIVTRLLGGFTFGWAKPVPYNPYNLRNQKWGPAIVGAAGPAANMTTGIFFGGLSMLLPLSLSIKSELFFKFLFALFRGNTSPLTLGTAPFETFYLVSLYIVWLNMLLAVFNLLPIPPLDGSKVLFAILPYRWHGLQIFLEQYGFFLLLIFIFFFSQWLLPVVLLLFRLVAGSFLF